LQAATVLMLTVDTTMQLHTF